MLIMKKILSIVGIIGGTFFLLVAAICVDNKAMLFVRKNQMNQKIGNPSFTKTVKQTDAELFTVKCKGCGGINKIQRGAVGECEYCGSPISGE